MLEQKNITVKAGSSFQTICPFPVGYIYQSYNSTSPANIYGGSWTPITGRFLYCNSGTSVGGANSIYLEKEQLPWHTHRPSNRTIVFSPNNKGNLGFSAGNIAATYGFMYEKAPTETDLIGGNVEIFRPSAVNIQPAYQTCYAWRRIA